MNALSICITHRTGDVERSIQIDCAEPVMPLSAVLESPSTNAITGDAMVPGNATDMADALTKIAAELQCDNNLDDMLHAIDRLSPPRLEWSATLCDGKSVDYAAAEKSCAALGEGWRLPTRFELESILDLTRHDPAVDTTKFPDTKSTWYWTGTPCAWSPAYAWIVDFSFGGAYVNLLRDDACVRAVRSVPAGQ